MRALIGAALIAAFAPAWGQHYRWTDERGKVHFSDSVPPASARDVQMRDAATPPAEETPEPYALREASRNFPLTLYSAPDCEGCEMARSLLNTRGLPFREVSVTTQEQYETLKGVVGSSAVPVLLVGNQVHKGFDEESYQLALDTAGYPKKGVLPPRKPVPPKPQAEPAQAQPEPRGPYAPSALR